MKTKTKTQQFNFDYFLQHPHSVNIYGALIINTPSLMREFLAYLTQSPNITRPGQLAVFHRALTRESLDDDQYSMAYESGDDALLELLFDQALILRSISSLNLNLKYAISYSPTLVYDPLVYKAQHALESSSIQGTSLSNNNNNNSNTRNTRHSMNFIYARDYGSVSNELVTVLSTISSQQPLNTTISPAFFRGMHFIFDKPKNIFGPCL